MTGACVRMLEEDAKVRVRADMDCVAALAVASEAAAVRLAALEASVRAMASERACGGACLDGLKPNQACTESGTTAGAAGIMVIGAGGPPAAAGADPNPGVKGAAGRCAAPGWAAAGPPLAVDTSTDGVVYVGLSSPTPGSAAAVNSHIPDVKPGPAEPADGAARACVASGVKGGGKGSRKGAASAARTGEGALAKQGCGCVVS